MRILLSSLYILFLVSCQHKIVDMDPIAPRAVLVSESTLTTSLRAVKVKKNTVENKANINSLQKEIDKGYINADKIRKAGKVTQEELELNYKIWETVSIKNQFIEAAAQIGVIDASELEAAAEKASKEAALLREHGIKADKTIAELKTDILKQAPDVARGKLVTKVTWIIVGLLVAGGGFLLFLRLLPLLTGR